VSYALGRRGGGSYLAASSIAYASSLWATTHGMKTPMPPRDLVHFRRMGVKVHSPSFAFVTASLSLNVQ
jgi:hypothetical protein